MHGPDDEIGVAPTAKWELEGAACANNGRNHGGEEEEEAEAEAQEEVMEGGHVMFAEAVYYALEGEDHNLEIQVLRLGEETGEASVSFYTEDESARAGSKYISTSGVLNFAAYERFKTLQIPIVNDSDWASTMEFKVHLRDPINCRLSRYHASCHVQIIDDDVFPTDRYGEQIRSKRVDQIGMLGLIWEYFKLNLKMPGMRWRALLTLVLNQVHIAYFLLTIYLNRYLVDVVFSTSVESEHQLLWKGSRKKTAMCIGVLWVAPFLLLHVAEVVKSRLDLGGIALDYLQTNLYRKYLDYSEAARSNVAPSAMTFCILNQTRKVVDSGLMQSVDLMRLLGKLLVVIVFVQDGHENHSNALMAIVVFPVLVSCLWAYFQLPHLVKLGSEAARAEIDVMHNVHQTTNCYRLIEDYQQRPKLNDQFAARVKALIDKRAAVQMVELNDSYVPSWLSTLLVGGYILLFSEKVIEGDLTLGNFLAMIRIFHDLGTEVKEVYLEVMELVRIIGPLRKITICMNEATDLLQKRKASIVRRQEMHRWMRLEPAHSMGRRPRRRRRESESNKAKGVAGEARLSNWLRIASFFETSDRVDEVPIEVRGLKYSFPVDAASVHVGNDLMSLNIEHLHTSQGELIAVIGAHKAGKQTFLKLLAGILHPDSGMVFVPLHLRSLHVTGEPLLLEGGLWHNLTFSAPDESPERVQRILERLGASEALQALRRELAAGGGGPDADMTWRWRLSAAELQLLQVARALVVNPEVLMIQRPATHFDRETYERMVGVLEEHVRERGIAVESAAGGRRQPRTCFFICSDRELALRCADRVWEVSGGTVSQLELMNSEME